MRKIIAIISASLLLLAWACTDDPEQVEIKYNENDLSVLKEVYASMDVRWPEYPCDLSRPETILDVTWENIGGEYRVVKFAPLSTGYHHIEGAEHEMTPRLGELTYLRTLIYGLSSLKGKIPREIFNCPLETLCLGASSGKVSGDFYPEIYKIANTIKSLSICAIDLGIDSEEFEKIFDFPNLEKVTYSGTNITGHVSAKFGEQNFTNFTLTCNHFTSCDLDLLYTKGTFPDLKSNDIYCEVPYCITKTTKWDTIVNLVDRYDSDKNIGFRVMPQEY